MKTGDPPQGGRNHENAPTLSKEGGRKYTTGVVILPKGSESLFEGGEYPSLLYKEGKKF